MPANNASNACFKKGLKLNFPRSEKPTRMLKMIIKLSYYMIPFRLVNSYGTQEASPKGYTTFALYTYLGLTECLTSSFLVTRLMKDRLKEKKK
jgi:hypothetical protein